MVFLNVDLGSPSSPNSNPTAIPATSPKTVPNRTNSTNELPWNNNLEMPLASGIRARNESSLGKRTVLSLFCPHIYGSQAKHLFQGSPSSPTSVSRNSLSGSSSIDDILLARKKTINTEMTHIKEARHASFISRHVRLLNALMVFHISIFRFGKNDRWMNWIEQALIECCHIRFLMLSGIMQIHLIGQIIVKILLRIPSQ